MINKKKKHNQPLFSLPNIALIGVISILFALSETLLKIPFDVQGETGLIGTALIIIAVGFINRAGTATFIGVMAGILAAVVNPSQHGFLYTVLLFAVTGIGVEIGLLIMGSVRHVLTATLVAVIGNLLHFTVKWLVGLLVGAPVGVIATALSTSVFYHILFGLMGGLLGFFVLYALDHSRIRPVSSE